MIKYLENDFIRLFNIVISIEFEIEQEDCCTSIEKNFIRFFQFCHFLWDINLSFDQKSLDEDVNFFVWSFDENSLFVQIVWLRTQQILHLQIFIWLRHAICNKLQRTTSFAWNKVQTQNDVEIKLLNTSFYSSFRWYVCKNKFLTKRLNLYVIARFFSECANVKAKSFVVFSTNVQMQQNESLCKHKKISINLTF